MSTWQEILFWIHPDKNPLYMSALQDAQWDVWLHHDRKHPPLLKCLNKIMNSRPLWGSLMCASSRLFHWQAEQEPLREHSWARIILPAAPQLSNKLIVSEWVFNTELKMLVKVTASHSRCLGSSPSSGSQTHPPTMVETWRQWQCFRHLGHRIPSVSLSQPQPCTGKQTALSLSDFEINE